MSDFNCILEIKQMVTHLNWSKGQRQNILNIDVQKHPIPFKS